MRKQEATYCIVGHHEQIKHKINIPPSIQEHDSLQNNKNARFREMNTKLCSDKTWQSWYQ